MNTISVRSLIVPYYSIISGSVEMFKEPEYSRWFTPAASAPPKLRYLLNRYYVIIAT